MMQAKRHRPAPFAPADWRVFENPDGSKTALTIGGARQGAILRKRLPEG